MTYSTLQHFALCSSSTPALFCRTFTIAVCLSATLFFSAAVSGQTVNSDKQNFVIETVAQGLSIPWGMAALPDGGILITERTGTLRLLNSDGKLHPDPITVSYTHLTLPTILLV